MSLGGQMDLPMADDAMVAIATGVTEAIYSAPFYDATSRQQGYALASATKALKNLCALGWRPPQENQ